MLIYYSFSGSNNQAVNIFIADIRRTIYLFLHTVHYNVVMHKYTLKLMCLLLLLFIYFKQSCIDLLNQPIIYYHPQRELMIVLYRQTT